MSIMLRISLLLGALFALGIVINSVRKSKIRISDLGYIRNASSLVCDYSANPLFLFSTFWICLNQQLCFGCCDNPDAHQTVPPVVQHFSPYL